MVETHQTRVNNITVSYLLKPSEEPDPLTLVFIHGFPFDSTIWLSQLKSLPDNVQGIAYDVRGFGNTSAGHTFYSIDLFARDLLTFVDHMSTGRTVLCGISMGGYIALRAAEINPARFSALVLSDTNAQADTDTGKLKRFETIEQVMAGGKGEFCTNFLKNLFSEHTFDTNRNAVELIERIILRTPGSVICSAQLALASRTSTMEFLSSSSLPLLILRGQEDKLMTAEQAAELGSGAGPSEYFEIPGAGHLPNLENPEVFNQLLSSFLNKHFPI